MPRLLPGGHCLPGIKEGASLRAGTKWLRHLGAGSGHSLGCWQGSPLSCSHWEGRVHGAMSHGSHRAVLWCGAGGTSPPEVREEGWAAGMGWSQRGCWWGCVLPRAWMNPWLVLQPLFHMECVHSTVNWGQQEGLASPAPVWVLFAPKLKHRWEVLESQLLPGPGWGGEGDDTFTWKGVLLPPAPSAPPRCLCVSPGCDFCFSSSPLRSHPGLDRLPEEEKTVGGFE